MAGNPLTYTASFANGDTPDATPVLTRFTDIKTLIEGGLSPANVSSGAAAGKLIVCDGSGVPQYTYAVPGASAYRTILTADGFLWDTGSGNPPASTYLLGSNSIGVSGFDYGMPGAGPNTVSPAATKNVPPRIFYFDDADYAVTGLTTKLRLSAQVAANATAPGITFTFGLYPVTVAGSTDILSYTAGTVVPNSTVAIATPGASTISAQNSFALHGDMSVPADGAYVLGVVTSGTMANNSAVSCHAQLSVRNV